jgi:hypothetical protein
MVEPDSVGSCAVAELLTCAFGQTEVYGLFGEAVAALRRSRIPHDRRES